MEHVQAGAGNAQLYELLAKLHYCRLWLSYAAIVDVYPPTNKGRMSITEDHGHAAARDTAGAALGSEMGLRAHQHIFENEDGATKKSLSASSQASSFAVASGKLVVKAVSQMSVE